MKWFKLDSDFPEDEKVNQCLDVLGHKGFTVWVILMAFLSQQYKGEPTKNFKIYARRLQKTCRVSSQNLHKTFTKLSQICGFSFTFADDFYNFTYPKFLEKQQKYFASVHGKYERPDVHIEVDKEADKEKEVDKKSIAVSGKPKQPLLADQDFINSLKANTAYKGIDIDRELSKMDAWLSTPRGRGRKKSRGFIVNWLNKIDTPIKEGVKIPRNMEGIVDWLNHKTEDKNNVR